MAERATKLTNEQKRAQLRKGYELSARGEFERSVEEGYAEDGVFYSQMTGREFRGKAAVKEEVKRQNQGGNIKWHLHDILVSDDHGVALMEAEQDGKRRRIVHILHLDDSGKIKEAWAVFNSND